MSEKSPVQPLSSLLYQISITEFLKSTTEIDKSLLNWRMVGGREVITRVFLKSGFYVGYTQWWATNNLIMSALLL